jgi:nitrite reductase/ring-hydroxylating ferredoxin subunit
MVQVFLAIVSLGTVGTQAYSFHNMPVSASPRRAISLSMKRGRGSFKKEIVGEGSGTSSSGSSAGQSRDGLNWLPLPVATTALPQKDGEIGILDTELFTLKNGATNPTGAVAVARQDGQTFCFSIGCPSCQIPLNKAKLVTREGQPILGCAFCKASFNLRTGQKVEALEKGGIFGGVVQSLFSAKDSGPLTMYKLAEKNGKLLIALD